MERAKTRTMLVKLQSGFVCSRMLMDCVLLSGRKIWRSIGGLRQSFSLLRVCDAGRFSAPCGDVIDGRTDAYFGRRK